MFENRLTVVFTKRPRPGEVKTRLAPAIGAERAAEFAEAMLADTLAKCASSREFSTALWIADERDLDWARAFAPEVARVEAQRGSGLADRLANFFELALAANPRSTHVVIGSDAPLLPLATIVAAHRALERGVELALAPDRGGGYALVALARAERRVFTEVAMSRSDMCANTLRLARELGLRTELLEPCFDVDLPEDLEHLRRELARVGDERAPQSARVLRTIR